MVKRINFLFMIMVLVLASCGSISYKYYHLTPDNGKLEGKLIAERHKDDTNLNTLCRDEHGAIKCIVISLDEFYLLKEDLLTTKKLLEECQRQLP